MRAVHMFNRLFEPTRIGKVQIKNRLAMAPMGIFSLCSTDGTITQRVVDYYTERAKGGTGLIITGLTRVENEAERFGPNTQLNLSLNPKHYVQTSFELTESVHAYGAKIFAQLTAGFGRTIHPEVLTSQPVAPSAIPNYWDPTMTCRELETNEVERLVKAFGKAAELTAEAGFDGVEIHAMHEGYLLDQFTVSMWNRRTDKYGGDLEGRLTFPVEILHTIKDKVGNSYPVQLRFSVKNYVKGWGRGALPGEIFDEAARDTEEGLEAARMLEKEGYDAFNADAGSYDAWYWAHPPIYMKHGLYLELTERLKKTVKAPVLVAGRMDIPELAVNAVEEGKADIVALGRALLSDPYWPSKVRERRIEEIRPCIGCHDSCFSGLLKPLSCSVNPSTGRERLFELKASTAPKKILVAGGGVAGMEAARVAALRGHEVSLFDKKERLGGHLVEGSVPDFKADLGRLLDWYRFQMKKTGVKVYLNTEVTPEIVETEKPEVLIIATGSRPLIPDIPGIQSLMVATCVDLLLGKRKAGSEVVVVGGGLVGCETALWLTNQGKKTTIVEMLPDLLISGIPMPHSNRLMLLDMISLKKVEVLTNTSLSEVKDGEVVLVDKEFKRKSIRCDTVALAIGLSPEDQLYDVVRERVPQVYVIGDCKEPKRITEAIWDGYVVANSL